MIPPDRPTELREQTPVDRLAEEINIELAEHSVKATDMVMFRQCLVDLIDRETLRRSRTDQRKLLESILKVRNGIEENYPHLCYWYERKMNEALARLEGEGKQ